MYIPLIEAPQGKTLVLVKVGNSILGEHLKHMGVFNGTELIFLEDEVSLHPVRVNGPKGGVILCGGMGSKIVAHLDDGRKLPILEMQEGDTGHIEGLAGGSGLAKAVNVLGLENGSQIQFVRKLPHMDYIVLIEETNRTRISSGMAARIWGRMDKDDVQFAAYAKKGKKFHVKELLGGFNACQIIEYNGIKKGSVIELEGIIPIQMLKMDDRTPLTISTRDGLRFLLSRKDARQILVEVKN